MYLHFNQLTKLHLTKMTPSTFKFNIYSSNHHGMDGKTNKCNVTVSLLCSFLLCLLSFSVTAAKPAALHSVRWLPGSRRGVLLLVWWRDGLTGATANLVWLQRSRQAEDGVFGPGDAEGGRLRSDPSSNAEVLESLKDKKRS